MGFTAIPGFLYDPLDAEVHKDCFGATGHHFLFGCLLVRSIHIYVFRPCISWGISLSFVGTGKYHH
jgi:hypothetical protein